MPPRRSDPIGLAQQHLAAIIQDADDAIISKNLESIVMSWNPAAERIFGYTAEEMIGQSILRIIPADLASEETDFINRIRKGERVVHHETRRVCKDGKTITANSGAGEALGRQSPRRRIDRFCPHRGSRESPAAGYKMHVAKPVEPGELLAIVASLAAFMDRRQ